MKFKDRMKKRRKDLGLTLEDVAKIVGVTRQTIQKYESGVVTNIPSDKIELIATALKTTPAYLMGWEEEKKEDIETIKNKKRSTKGFQPNVLRFSFGAANGT